MTPAALRELILGDTEFALLDVREQGAFSRGHLLFAACLPLSRMELLVADLVPRTDTCVIVVAGSAHDPLGERALVRLRALGYTDVQLLDGGVDGWRDAGGEVFTGINVPSKAFGEFVEQRYDTPRLPAAEIKAMLDSGRDMVIVDSRPFDEYQRMNIPTATDVPGAELALRIHDLAPDPDTLVVVNCAGRTRSIIGAQSLLNAGIPNPVVALKDGTMGWHLAGYPLEHGATRRAAEPSAAARKHAQAAAARVRERFGVRRISRQTLAAWSRDAQRTTFLLDVRSPEEFAAGHLPGWRHAPGGQLVQATDEYVAVRNARLVLGDDDGVRATMTASWLLQMGWPEVWVLEGGIGSDGLVSGPWRPTVLDATDAAGISPAALAERLDETHVIDLGPSLAHDRAHIPGAHWCVRARLNEALQAAPAGRPVVLTSPDGVLAGVALAEARSLVRTPVDYLAGGTERWVAEGRATQSGIERVVGPIDDLWYKPYDNKGSQEAFMRDYLTWEVALVDQIERDGTTRFKAF